jgi:hypothetical protein
MMSNGRPASPLDAADAMVWLADSPAALATLDATGLLLWANAACSALTGPLTAGSPLGGQLRLDEHDAIALRNALGTGGSADLQQRRGGTAAWLRADVRITTDGRRLLALQSIAGEMAARNEAQQRGELLELARSIGRIGVWDRNVRTGEGHWDRQVFRMRGMEGEGEAPNFETAISTTLEADRAGLQKVFSESMRQAGTYAHRYRVLGLDHRVRHLHSQWVVKNGSDGRPERVIGLIMDDTQAWALARSYDEMVSQLALAVDLGGIAIWRHDLATNRMHYNDQAFAMLDMAPRPDGLTLDEVRAMIHPDDLAHVLASADGALHSDRPVDIEARYRRRDGQYRSVMMRRAVQRDADGQPLAFIGVALDVTERLGASRRALELGRRFELATRAAGIGYWSLENGLDHARWSDQMRVIHGLAPDAPVPTMKEWLAQYVHADDRDDVRRRFADWGKSGRANLEADFRIRRSDGVVRHLITHSRVEDSEQRPLLFGLVIDVTERRSVEMALREASERASLAARSVGIGAWELDLLDGTVFWDEQMWRLRGRKPRGQPPSADGRLAMVHDDDRDGARAFNEGLFEDDRPTHHEFRVMLPDGRVRWLASRSTPVRDEQGRLVRRIGVNWDVTDRRTAEAVRQEREIAQRESQAKSKFLARMSHELRTPLNAVLGFTQLLLSEDRASDDAAQSRRRRLEHIRAAGQHLLELINDVLDLSSLEGGEVRIALQPVPVAPLIAETLPLLEPLLRERGVELVTGALDAVPLADATRLRQILLNLLSNAIKYNRDGGRVTVEALRRGDTVLVRVADTGRGMTDLQMRHLFEPFNRLGIETEGIEGTGIGLAIVKALIERMGGSVHVDSTLGAGSLFELRLADGSLRAPPAPTSVPSSRPIPLLDADTPPRGTLLYVEDNPVNALIISELIARRADLRLHIAEDGLSGVRKAQELRPDLVLLDMQLPDIDGHEVLRRLRADAATANIPVIALSANAMPEDIDRALRAGMSDYWTKPLDFRAFMASIEALFGPG